VTPTAPKYAVRRAQHTQVLQIERTQCVFDSVAEPNNATLYIGAEKRDKNIALSYDLGLAHCTGTAGMIGKILLHLKNGLICAIQVGIQSV
jgi:hypothetical protein